MFTFRTLMATAAVSALGAFAPALAQDTVTMKFGTHLTPQHNLTVNAVEPWMEMVTELSDGRIEFQHFPNSQMGKASDIYKLVGNGTLDVGYTLYVQDSLPLMDLPALPNMYSDIEAGTKAWWTVLNQPPMSDYLDELNLKPIMPIVWSPYAIATIDSKPQTLEDFAGLKLRSSGGLHDQAAAALGITPVAISMSETLVALQKGTVDGYWGSNTALTDYQFTQVIDNAVTNLPLNGWGGVFAMNKDRFDALPEDLQAAIEEANARMAEELGAYINDYAGQSAWDAVTEAGVELYQVDQSVVDAVAEKLEPITTEWINEQNEAGYPATEVYEQFREAYENNLTN